MFFFVYLITMKIDTEIGKLNTIVNNKKIPSFENFKLAHPSLIHNKVTYMLYVLQLTYDHPEIEPYLKQLLENYSIEELNNFDDHNSTILHCMVYNLVNISLNSFEIIINFGISVNSQNEYGNTPLHFINNRQLKHQRNVIGLFVEYGANLNILSNTDKTILDVLTCRYNMNEIIMLLIDFGAKTNNPYNGTKTLEFVESYSSNSIKPAIKK